MCYRFIKSTFACAAFAFLLTAGAAQAQDAQLEESTVSWIQKAAKDQESKAIAWRRDLHQYPELGNAEVRTSKVIADHLRSVGVEVETGVAKTGVIGILKGDKPGPVVALRADMDALPLKENSGLPFASKARGNYYGTDVDVMHACGHDVHVAMLMGAAEILAKNKDKIAGTVIFIFQPAEEGAADIDDFTSQERYGARRIVQDGYMEKYKIDAVFGIHIMPRYPTGQYAYKPNIIMSSIDDFRITVKGKGTHGSMPWTGTDAIYASAQIINAAQSLISRRSNLMSGFGAVSFGSISGGNASNVIPDEVKLKGTMRTTSAEVRNTLLTELKPLVEGIAKSLHTDAFVELADIYPVTNNDPQLTNSVMPMLGQLNNNNMQLLSLPSSGGEDFSFYAEKVPGLFIFLGVSNADNGRDISNDPTIHNSDIMIDERAILDGMMAHVGFVKAYEEFSKNKPAK